MSQRSESKWSSSLEEDLSSLMDGELEASEALQACNRWREDPEARATWYSYQLIGDVLRSEDLASAPQRDRAFLSALQHRLEEEPVILAPAPLARARAPRRTWIGAAAVAAGFATVAGVLVVTQMSGSSADSQSYVSTSVERLPSPVQAVSLQASSGVDASAIETQVMIPNGQLVRDVRLDEYLAAHKKFGGSSALGAPSGFLRNAAATDEKSR